MNDDAVHFAVMRDVRRTYDREGRRGVRGANFTLLTGEVHLLMGGNGAGKTTLMRILCGRETATGGSLHIRGQVITKHSPALACREGIWMVPQHSLLIPHFTVLQNIILGQEPRRAGLFLDDKKASRSVSILLEKYGFTLPLEERVSSLTISQRQQTELLKALYRESTCLILDEPTAMLGSQETKRFLQVVGELAREGKTIVIITHHVHAVEHLVDRVTVMREGKSLLSTPWEGTGKRDVMRVIVQGWTPPTRTKKSTTSAEVVISLREIHLRKGKGARSFSKLSLQVYAGEIVGIVGEKGSDLKGLEELLGGEREPSSGEIFYRGQTGTMIRPRHLRNEGWGYAPSDRLRVGCAASFTVGENLAWGETFPTFFTKRTFLQRSRCLLKEYAVEGSPHASMQSLSGGNLQKGILGREFLRGKKGLLLCEPTAGLDQESRENLRRRVLSLRDKGKTFLLLTSDWEEAVAFVDRIIVLRQNGCFLDPLENEGEGEDSKRIRTLLAELSSQRKGPREAHPSLESLKHRERACFCRPQALPKEPCYR